MLKMSDMDLRNKRVLIREDFNVPLENGKITSDARLVAALPTIKFAQEKGAKIILMKMRLLVQVTAVIHIRRCKKILI